MPWSGLCRHAQRLPAERAWQERERRGAPCPTKKRHRLPPAGPKRRTRTRATVQRADVASQAMRLPVAEAVQVGTAFVSGEAGVAQPSAWGQVGSGKLPEAACVSACRRGKNARAARGRGLGSKASERGCGPWLECARSLPLLWQKLLSQERPTEGARRDRPSSSPEPVAVQPCRILVRAPSHSTHE